jgi:AcrR family transcriptional regulator
VARIPAPDSRERILHAAARLFYAHGVRAVGTDRVVTAAGTGKKLLYQHFPTKDALVAAYLDLVRERRTAETRQALDAAGADPGAGLVAVVAEVGELLRDPRFRGCAVRNYLVEHPEPPAGAGAVARAYLADSRAVVDELAARLGVPDPGAVADQLWLLVDALYLKAAYRAGADVDRAVDAAVRLARAVVDAAPVS